MKSKASFDGHPIHPILVGFPIAFFTGALVFDILGAITKNENHTRTGRYLAGAGILGGLAAAVPGIIDYFCTVPPDSSAKERATTHGILNLSMVTLYTIAWLARQNKETPQAAIIALESGGFIVMGIAGWMGGTLVYRNQIGVYNRYANAGKWNEAFLEKTWGRVAAADVGELKTGQMKLVHIDHKRIVIGRTADGYTAFDDQCTHKGGSLASGVMIRGIVQCPWHGSQFDCHTGKVLAGPAQDKINTYKTEVENGKIWLVLG
jgi:nitrite reductase/ring-hydroxylating ferredoxin subunit/uncharacterized membrane protein